ncbi:MAG TPA: ammonia channel protein, partial [Ottowia sp.]|nr:ammonia channel protein [Ottowia sp.]
MKKRIAPFALACGLALALPGAAWAQAATDAAASAAPAVAAAAAAAPAPRIDSGDTAWMLTSTLLVILMT